MTQAAMLQALPLAIVSLRHRRSLIRAWRERAHPPQIPPEGDWRIWYVRGGRGGGKTWTGANTLAEWAQETVGEYAVVAPTYADARDTCVEGPSGLLKALGPAVATWNRSLHDLRLTNGSVIWADGADDGAGTIQGKNLRALWADEVGLWRKWKRAWEESIRYAVRLSPARIVATGTPKRGHPLVKSLMDDPAVRHSLLLTIDNVANLDAGTVADLMGRYAGTLMGRQELEGEVIDEVEGALWSRELIEASRQAVPLMYDIARQEHVPHMRRIVVAIDPAVTSNPDSDETGIVVDGIAPDGTGWMLQDASMKGSPAAWASRAVAMYHAWHADLIVAEANNGGEMVSLTIRTVDPNVPVKLVHASQGKRTRAEPVSALYEQHRVKHMLGADLARVEDQMCSWDPTVSDDSPDRMDAHVWGITELMLNRKGWGAVSGPVESGIA